MWPLALPLCRHRATIQIPLGSARGHHSCIFIFTFLQNQPLWLSVSPFVSHEAPRLCHKLACCERSPPVWGNAALGRGRHTECSAGPKGPLGCHWMLGWREGESAEPSIRAGLWGWLLVGPWWLLSTSPHPGAIPTSAAGCAPWGSESVSSGVSGCPCCLCRMKRSGLASAVTPRWPRALPAPRTDEAGSC